MAQRILLIEDSVTQAERLRLLLVREGYEVELARTGLEGLEKARPGQVDLVISDVTMPEMDGFAFCRAMKASEQTKRIPIILLTAQARPADIITGLQCGADNFIPKTYDDDYLLSRVGRIFEQLEHRREEQLEMEVNLTIGGRKLTITADRQQIMELLLSTFDELGRNYDTLARANDELTKARLAAEQANQAKTEFVSRMSHELRTPLNAILGFGQLLELYGLDERQAEAAARILRAGRHLLDLINEILDISRVEGGTLAVSPEPVRLGDAVGDVLALMTPLARDRETRLSNDLGTHADSYVLADRQRLKQVLINLVSNAIKYNRRGGLAAVTAEPTDDGAMRVLVRDEGAGIPADKLDRLFSPFDRLGAEASEVEGTGLGLALSKRLVEVMGGTIAVETQAGSGSTFIVELQGCEPQQAVSRPSSRAAPDRVGVRLRPATILYVEDNLANVRLVEAVLAGQEIELISSTQGSVGLDLARQNKPDLILLDLHLPDLGGVEVLERLKADPATENIPVVMLSADASERRARALLELGAREYLTKPLDLTRFIVVIDEALAEISDRS
ncbi:MAG: response regulator [Actinomycetota bacterium]|nr:response regulator [Actinomycetota bacterium]